MFTHEVKVQVKKGNPMFVGFPNCRFVASSDKQAEHVVQKWANENQRTYGFVDSDGYVTKEFRPK